MQNSLKNLVFCSIALFNLCFGDILSPACNQSVEGDLFYCADVSYNMWYSKDLDINSNKSHCCFILETQNCYLAKITEKCLDKDVESQKVHFDNGKDNLGEQCKIYLLNKCVITDRDKKRERLPKLKCQDQIDHYNTECQVIVNSTTHKSENSCCFKLKNFDCVENKVRSDKDSCSERDLLLIDYYHYKNKLACNGTPSISEQCNHGNNHGFNILLIVVSISLAFILLGQCKS